MRTSRAYLEHRAELVRVARPARSRPATTVLDLACGDGGLAELLLGAGFATVGVDASAGDGRRPRAGARRASTLDVGDLNDYVPPAPVRRRRSSARSTTRATAARSSSTLAGYTREEARLRPEPAPVRARRRPRRSPRGGLRDGSPLRPFFVPQTALAAGRLLRAATALERVGPVARLALRFRFTYLVAASRR